MFHHDGCHVAIRKERGELLPMAVQAGPDFLDLADHSQTECPRIRSERPGVRFGLIAARTIEIIRAENSAAELRALASSTRDGRVVRHLLAFAPVLEGESRAEAAQLLPWIARRCATGCVATGTSLANSKKFLPE